LLAVSSQHLFLWFSCVLILFFLLSFINMGDRKRKIDIGDLAPKSKFSEGMSAASASGINPLNGRPFSQRYYDILAKRKTLPVYEFRDQFAQMVTDNQVLVLVGETGSGKTTQVCELRAPVCLCRELI
jgi:hypothetical protein